MISSPNVTTDKVSDICFKYYFNIKMDLKEIGWEGMNWIHLAQDWDQWQTLVNAVMNLRVSEKTGI
jgi:hypothetical protein